MIPAVQAAGILSRQYQALFGARPTRGALFLLLAQSRGEGKWGDFSGVDAEGRPWGHNWGAVQSKHAPPCPWGTFQRQDSRPTAQGQVTFPWCFMGYLTDDDGARDFLKHALAYRPAAKRAVISGDPEIYARALYGNGSAPYYGGFGATAEERIQGYATMLRAQREQTMREIGDIPLDLISPDVSVKPHSPTSQARVSPAVFVLAGLAAYLIVRK